MITIVPAFNDLQLCDVIQPGPICLTKGSSDDKRYGLIFPDIRLSLLEALPKRVHFSGGFYQSNADNKT